MPWQPTQSQGSRANQANSQRQASVQGNSHSLARSIFAARATLIAKKPSQSRATRATITNRTTFHRHGNSHGRATISRATITEPWQPSQPRPHHSYCNIQGGLATCTPIAIITARATVTTDHSQNHIHTRCVRKQMRRAT